MAKVSVSDVAEYDTSLFSSAELSMMSEALGSTDRLFMEPNTKELQAQAAALARLVAEGGDRECQLRDLINDLNVLAATSAAQHQSIFEQTQALAQIVIGSSAREVKLQESLKTLRETVFGRAKQIM